MQHHSDTLSRYVDKVSRDPATLAVISTGSVARGTERADSDVDLYLVLTEDAFAAAAAANALSYTDHEIATYEGGYVDVKVASEAYLATAHERADEPTRASLLGAVIVFSRLPGLEEELDRITALPESAWDERALSFVAQMRLYGGYFLAQGTQLGDDYLRAWAAVHMVNAAGRAILAANRVLFAGPKYLQSTVAAIPDLPKGYGELVAELLQNPAPDAGMRLLVAVESYRAWGLPYEQSLSRFVHDNELAWLRSAPAPEFL